MCRWKRSRAAAGSRRGDAGGAGERGSASVEQAALAALLALLLLAAIAAVAAGGEVDGGRELGRTLGRRLVCGPHLPGACRHDPLLPAYGEPLARAVRALAPPPAARRDGTGLPLLPVDFRRCRRASCARAAGSLRLTASNRRTTAFTALVDRRRTLGWVEISYWLYRPTLGWERLVRRAAEAEIAAAAATELGNDGVPVLVPLETLPGRNHYAFPANERPPWQWQVAGRYPGFSS